MMPLWMSTISPEQSMWGWAFSSDGRAVGGPPGVADADAPAERGRGQRSGQVDQLAGAAAAVNGAVLDHGDPGRIVATVFQSLERLQKRGAVSLSPTYPTMPHIVIQGVSGSRPPQAAAAALTRSPHRIVSCGRRAAAPDPTALIRR